MGCVFCKIAAGEIPADIVFENENLIAFKDISPAAPVHILIIPKQHIVSARDIDASNSDIIASIFETISFLAEKFGIANEGFRVVNNCGENGGQTVAHLHFHLLGGRGLAWPPG